MSYYDRDRMNAATRLVAGTMNHAYSHVGNTSEYLASGYPFFCSIATGTAVTFADDATGNGSSGSQTLDDDDIISVAFPYVSRWVIVKGFKNGVAVAHDQVFVGVSKTGVTTPFPCQADLALIGGMQLEMKCSKLYFRIDHLSAVSYTHLRAHET